MGLGGADQEHQLADSAILMRAVGDWLHKAKCGVSDGNFSALVSQSSAGCLPTRYTCRTFPYNYLDLELDATREKIAGLLKALSEEVTIPTHLNNTAN